MRLSSLTALTSLTIEGFYLGEVHSAQAPFGLISRLLDSWSSLPPSQFRLNLDIVFARRLSSYGFPRIPVIDVMSFLQNSMDVQWDEIQTLLEKARFPEVALRLTSQEGALQIDEKTQLMDTIYDKMERLHHQGILTVEVTAP